MKKFSYYLLKQKIWILALFIVSMLMAIALAAAAYIWKIIYDEIFIKNDSSRVKYIAILLSGLISVSYLLKVLRDFMLTRLGGHLCLSIRRDFLQEILSYRYAFFLSRASAEFVKRAIIDTRLIAEGLTKTLMGVMNATQLICWYVFFLIIFPPAVVIYFIIATLFITWVFLWRRQFSIVCFSIGKSIESLWLIIYRVFSGIVAIKLDLLKNKSLSFG
ncbi:MAG: ABC transporter ATP-binding protein [Deltaproteobacteria bacterium]|nr:ABC transporter ATP-binding protein [Deltaproteobacteria bacterium]